MLNIENSTTVQFDHASLEKISNALSSREIDLSICDNQTIQKYNSLYRGKNKHTDVLSFPIDTELVDTKFEHIPLGSIVISIDYVKKLSQELGHTVDEELSLLFIHGLLHLLGYDHETDNGEMREMEEELINKFNLPKSLIVRNI
ncbi:MAG TPA: rRNA maturation RNase YbeY [Campylobacterales bacterium]|nr:rRNA maturation RNase YbeY [Campylobacterales bacterium]